MIYHLIKTLPLLKLIGYNKDMIKAVIFDLNGIFLQSPKLSDRFSKDFGVKTDVFLPKLSEIMDKVRKPNDYWFKGEIQSEKMIAFAKSLRQRGVKVYILSNNFKERADYYNQYPWIHDAVDKVYFSWQTGFVKPDVRAWELVLAENNLKGEECLYFDDQDKNIKSAESLGIISFKFTNEEELEKIVNEKL